MTQRSATARTADVAVSEARGRPDSLLPERPDRPSPLPVEPADFGRVAVVGAGRLGSVLVKALRAAGIEVSGPHGRGYAGRTAEGPDHVVLLCVPDAAITEAASKIALGPWVGHCSGATGLAVLVAHRRFSMHPVMTFTPDSNPDVFTGIGAAIDGSDAGAQHLARRLAERIGMRPFVIRDVDRAAYHASTAFAANFLVTLESAAGRLMESAGADRSVLLPLARAALENWGCLGVAALTGPVARGDRRTVDLHRTAVAERIPDQLTLFDAMVDATRALVPFPKNSLAPVDSSAGIER